LSSEGHLKGVDSYKAAGPGIKIIVVDLPLLTSEKAEKTFVLQNKPNSSIKSYFFSKFVRSQPPKTPLDAPRLRFFATFAPVKTPTGAILARVLPRAWKERQETKPPLARTALDIENWRS
jgi:hypothetical protein